MWTLRRPRERAGTLRVLLALQWGGAHAPTTDMNERMNETSSDTPIVKSTVEARQGVTGHNVRYVLMISLAAVIVLMAIAGIVFNR
jgi:hypothetical protein